MWIIHRLAWSAILSAPMFATPSVVHADAAAAPAEDEAGPGVAPAASGEDSASLAKQLTSPVSSLVGVPFQQNVDFGFEPDGDVKATLNIQSIIPIRLSEDLNATPSKAPVEG